MRAELDAAGITGQRLRAAYTRARRLNARHGRTFFLATRLLAPAQRPAIHALYGFARWADDLVDEPARAASAGDIAAALDGVRRGLAAALHGALEGAVDGAVDAPVDGAHSGVDGGSSDQAVLAAVAHTAARYAIAPETFDAFLRSMRMDLSTTDYATRAELEDYMHGSAEVIGLQVLPVLGHVSGRDDAALRAAALGRAFQLTNFLRDVAGDLDRGRVYLPADELAAFGVDRDRLVWCARREYPDAAVRAALADQIARTRAEYRYARGGIAMLHPVSRPCVATALRLYSAILERIEAADGNVFGHRARVSLARRLSVAVGAAARAGWARRRHPAPAPPGPVAG